MLAKKDVNFRHHRESCNTCKYAEFLSEGRFWEFRCPLLEDGQVIISIDIGKILDASRQYVCDNFDPDQSMTVADKLDVEISKFDN